MCTITMPFACYARALHAHTVVPPQQAQGVHEDHEDGPCSTLQRQMPQACSLSSSAPARRP